MVRPWFRSNLIFETTCVISPSGAHTPPPGTFPYYGGSDACYPNGELRLRFDPVENLKLEGTFNAGTNTRASRARGLIEDPSQPNPDLLIDMTQLSADFSMTPVDSVFAGFNLGTMHWGYMSSDRTDSVLRTVAFNMLPYRQVDIGYRRGPADGDHVSVRWMPFATDNVTLPLRAYFGLEGAYSVKPWLTAAGNLHGGLNRDLNPQWLMDATLNFGEETDLVRGLVYGFFGYEGLQDGSSFRGGAEGHIRVGNKTIWGVGGLGYIYQESDRTIPHHSFYWTVGVSYAPWDWLRLSGQFVHHGTLMTDEIFEGVGGTYPRFALQALFTFDARYPEVRSSDSH